MEPLALAAPADPLMALRHAVDRLFALQAAHRPGGQLVHRPTAPATVVLDPQAFRIGVVDDQGRLRWRLVVDGRVKLDVHLERARPQWDLIGPEPSWDWTTAFSDLYENVEDVGEEARWCPLSNTLHVLAEPWQLSVTLESRYGHTVTDHDVAAACAAARAVLESRLDPQLPIDRDVELLASLPAPGSRWLRRRKHRHAAR